MEEINGIGKPVIIKPVSLNVSITVSDELSKLLKNASITMEEEGAFIRRENAKLTNGIDQYIMQEKSKKTKGKDLVVNGVTYFNPDKYACWMTGLCGRW